MAIYNNKEKELTEEELEGVSGGSIFFTFENDESSTAWEIIDDSNGSVLDTCDDALTAAEIADDLGVSRKVIHKDELFYLRTWH